MRNKVTIKYRVSTVKYKITIYFKILSHIVNYMKMKILGLRLMNILCVLFSGEAKNFLQSSADTDAVRSDTLVMSDNFIIYQMSIPAHSLVYPIL